MDVDDVISKRKKMSLYPPFILSADRISLFLSEQVHTPTHNHTHLPHAYTNGTTHTPTHTHTTQDLTSLYLFSVYLLSFLFPSIYHISNNESWFSYREK